MKSKKIVRSHFIAAGPLGHELSPLSSLGHGISGSTVDEITLSSAWLWQQKSEGTIKPRFSVGFPDEWEELKKNLNLSSHLRIDLWIFKKLSQIELLNLTALMSDRENFRVILAVNHFLNWQELMISETLLGWAQQERALISFLPSNEELDPFLKPQEVLVALDRIGDSFPILITEFQSDMGRFYRTLQKEDHPLLTRGRPPILIRFFKTLEFWGLGHFVLALESLFGLLLEGRWNRLPELFRRIFTPPAFLNRTWNFAYYKTGPALGWIYHKYLRPTWTILMYQGLFRLWVLMRYKSIPILLILLYPVRKLYWMAEYQYQKRIQKRIRG